MATETLVKKHTAGRNVYFALWNSAGQVFDWSAGVRNFVALASAVTPTIAAATVGDSGAAGGGSQDVYLASLNLSDLTKNNAVVKCVAVAYERAGGSPAPATDTAISQPTLIEAAFGELAQKREVAVQLGISTKTTAGNTVQLQVWLEVAGSVVDLSTIAPAATCQVTVYLFGTPLALFQVTTGDFGAPDADDRFEAEHANPNFTADRQYYADVVVTALGSTFTARVPFTVFP